MGELFRVEEGSQSSSVERKLASAIIDFISVRLSHQQKSFIEILAYVVTINKNSSVAGHPATPRSMRLLLLTSTVLLMSPVIRPEPSARSSGPNHRPTFSRPTSPTSPTCPNRLTRLTPFLGATFYSILLKNCHIISAVGRSFLCQEWPAPAISYTSTSLPDGELP